MLLIEAIGINKSFGPKKIVEDLSFEFSNNQKIAFVGSNGSGKSTLLKILLCYMQPDSGKVVYKLSGCIIDSEMVFRYVSFCAPYQQLPEELTAKRLYEFVVETGRHLLGREDFFELACSHRSDLDKPIRLLSSGMKQRLKLSLAFGVRSEAIFLDEPTSNLDQTNKSWYYTNFKYFTQNRMVFLASNEALEYKNFDAMLDLEKTFS